MICNYENCNKTKIRARGLCSMHWSLEQYGPCKNLCLMPASNSNGFCANCNKRKGNAPSRRNLGSIINSTSCRVCSTCKNIFPIDEFAKSNHKNRCNKCQINMKKHSALLKKYKITLNKWNEIVESQGGGCAICGEIEKLCVDHDHSCCSGNQTCGNCIRGIICDKCNRAIGLMKNNPFILKNASKYLYEYENMKGITNA